VTGPEHYKEAELCLLGESCEYGCPHSGCEHEMRMIARAQAHFTAALAAATALDPASREFKNPDLDAWRKAVGEARDA
jgi:hypothetical protein